MENQNTIVYLNTPLIQPEGDKPILDNTYRIKGKIVSKDNDGFAIQVSAIGNKKEWDKSPPFKKIFLPMHKIDFVEVE